MIRAFQPADLNSVCALWLAANLQAHSFIPSEYWKANQALVRKLLPQAEAYVYEKGGEILGFAGWTANILSVRAGGRTGICGPAPRCSSRSCLPGRSMTAGRGARQTSMWRKAALAAGCAHGTGPGAGHCNAGEKARLGQGEVRHVPRLPAPLPEVCHPVWQPDKEAWAVYQPEWEGAGP